MRSDTIKKGVDPRPAPQPAPRHRRRSATRGLSTSRSSPSATATSTSSPATSTCRRSAQSSRRRPRGRRRAVRVQHHRRRRRHRDGPRRHEVLAAQSRELIADCVETMIQAHCFDGMICIPNCDKIVPGMLMGAVRVNIPTIFVCGGPMEAGRDRQRPDGRPDRRLRGRRARAPPGKIDDARAGGAGEGRLPDLRLAAPGMFTANSMNCLCEALGMALPGNGTDPGRRPRTRELVRQAARAVRAAGRSGTSRRATSSPAGVRQRHRARRGDGRLDQHGPAHAGAGREAGVDYPLDTLQRRRRARATPDQGVSGVGRGAQWHMEDVHGQAASRRCSRSWPMAPTCCTWGADGHRANAGREPGGRCTTPTPSASGPSTPRIRRAARSAVLFGNLAPRRRGGQGRSCRSARDVVHAGRRGSSSREEAAHDGILAGLIKAGDVVVIRHEGPRGGPGMREMLALTCVPQGHAVALRSRSSPMAASPAARGASASATSRPRRPRAARSPPARRATRSTSTCRDAASRVRLTDEELRGASGRFTAAGAPLRARVARPLCAPGDHRQHWRRARMTATPDRHHDSRTGAQVLCEALLREGRRGDVRHSRRRHHAVLSRALGVSRPAAPRALPARTGRRARRRGLRARERTRRRLHRDVRSRRNEPRDADRRRLHGFARRSWRSPARCSSALGTDAFQETDITGITIPITKHNYLVTNVARTAACHA